MKYVLLGLSSAFLFLMMNPASAANAGLITKIDFASVAYPPTPDIVQIQIAGGFLAGTCNQTLAGVRKIDSHIISFLLAAFASSTPVIVELDQGNRYFLDRCLITVASALAP